MATGMMLCEGTSTYTIHGSGEAPVFDFMGGLRSFLRISRRKCRTMDRYTARRSDFMIVLLLFGKTGSLDEFLGEPGTRGEPWYCAVFEAVHVSEMDEHVDFRQVAEFEVVVA